MITLFFGITHWLTLREALLARDRVVKQLIAANREIANDDSRIVGAGCLYLLSFVLDFVIFLTAIFLHYGWRPF